MNATNLPTVRIEPADNGGHTVIHEPKPKISSKGGSMGGGVYMKHLTPQKHSFGPEDGAEVLRHLSKVLNIKMPEGWK